MLLGVDVGGTFTDAVCVSGDQVVTAKTPTTPQDQSEGVINAVQTVLDLSKGSPSQIERFVHGMTVATNALLEDKTAPTALLTTEGFCDLEELGRQARADLYRLCVGHPPPLVPSDRRIPVPERVGPQGTLAELDEDSLKDRLSPLGEVEAVAICLLWGFRYPDHEQRCERIVSDRYPHLHVSTSHETAGVVREYERLATTVVDAALSPLLRGYLKRLSDRVRGMGLPEPEVMLSGGGVVDSRAVASHGSWAVLSGPAAGAVGAAWTASQTQNPTVICLDLGGTSCDVCLASSGQLHESGQREIGGRALALPMVDVHTVGAGGGSIAWADAGGALRVGPHSSGADPGPACYGRGGTEPTVTDAGLVLGYLDATSPLAGGVELDTGAAKRAVSKLARELSLSDAATAAGIFRVASIEMARAVRVMTVERGIDPRELSLLCFGGAGPVHATAVAEELGIVSVLVPPSSGVLSALGLLVSERRRDLVQSVLLSKEQLTRDAVAEVVERLATRGRADLDAGECDIRASYDLRYVGQAFELTIPGDAAPEPTQLRKAFEDAHERRYGYTDPDASLELVTVRVTVALPGSNPHTKPYAGTEELGTRRAVFGGEDLEAAVIRGVPSTISGPAICELSESTLVVSPGWKGERQENGTLVLERL
jgi:N-methylhydantoinase A